MNTRRNIFIAVAFLSGLSLLTPLRGLANIRVTPVGHIGELTETQKQDVTQALLTQHLDDPSVVPRILDRAVVIDPQPVDAHALVVTITEDTPGEIEPCLIIVVVGDFDASDDINTIRGDGSFDGKADSTFLFPWGTLLEFHGTPSDKEPLNLHLDLNFGTILPPAPIIVTGPDQGFPPVIRLFDPAGQNLAGFFAFDPSFTGGVRVAAGDVTGDGVPDIIAGTGPGADTQINIFNGAGLDLVGRFSPFLPGFQGGAYVAAADINGDGFADIIAGAGEGGFSQVNIFSGQDLSLGATFLAFDPAFRGGVRVAAGDVSGDGVPDVIAGAGPGGEPRVRVFDGASGAQLPGPIGNFLAYDASFRGGVYVAAGDINGDGLADVVTGAGEAGLPQVNIFSGLDGSLRASLLAFDPGFLGGVRVAAADINGDGVPDIISGAGPGGEPRVVTFSIQPANPIVGFSAYDASFPGGVHVGALVLQQEEPDRKKAIIDLFKEMLKLGWDEAIENLPKGTAGKGTLKTGTKIVDGLKSALDKFRFSAEDALKKAKLLKEILKEAAEHVPSVGKNDLSGPVQAFLEELDRNGLISVPKLVMGGLVAELSEKLADFYNKATRDENGAADQEKIDEFRKTVQALCERLAELAGGE